MEHLMYTDSSVNTIDGTYYNISESSDHFYLPMVTTVLDRPSGWWPNPPIDVYRRDYDYEFQYRAHGGEEIPHQLYYDPRTMSASHKVHDLTTPTAFSIHFEAQILLDSAQDVTITFEVYTTDGDREHINLNLATIIKDGELRAYTVNVPLTNKALRPWFDTRDPIDTAVITGSAFKWYVDKGCQLRIQDIKLCV